MNVIGLAMNSLLSGSRIPWSANEKNGAPDGCDYPDDYIILHHVTENDLI